MSVAYSPDGKFIVSGSVDSTVRIWNLPDGKLEGHLGAITSVAYSPYGKFIATGSLDKTVRIWNLAYGKEI